MIDFEEEIADLFNKGKIRAPVHLYQGNEDEIIEFLKELKKNDWIFCSWRSHYQCLLKGVPKDEVKKKNFSWEINIFMFSSTQNLFISISWWIGSNSCWNSFLLKIRNEKYDGLLFMGEMTSETGIVHECIKYSRNLGLPIHFIIEDNQKSVCTDTRDLETKKT